MRYITRDRDFYKSFFRLTSVIALQNIIVYAVNLADNIMLGSYGESAMSGVALVNQIQFLLQMVIVGVGEGVVILGSRFWGKKTLDPIKDVVSVGLKCGLLIAAVMWAAVSFFPEQVFSVLSNDPAEVAEACAYAKIVCFTYFFFSVTTVLLASLRSVETVAVGFVVSCIALVVNVGLNYILIFGKFGAPRLGAVGAAWATFTARAAELCVVIVYLIFFDKKIRMTVKSLFTFKKELFKPYVKTSVPMVGSGFFWGLAMFMQAAILGHLQSGGNGVSVIAANSVATTVFSIVSVFSYGAANATSVLIGKTIGEGKRNKLKEYSVTLQMLFLLIGIAAGALLFFSRHAILSFYDIADQTRDLADSLICVLSVTIIGTSYQVACLTGIVRGSGDTKFVLFNDLIFMWLLVLPVSFAAAFWLDLSPTVVFICLKSDQVLKCIVAAVKVNRFRWIDNIDKYVKLTPAESGSAASQ